MSLSNNITAVLNFVSFLCSFPIITAGIWLATKADNQCLHLARWPLILLGGLILLVSLAGFVGAFYNRPCLLALYLFAMAAVIVVLIAFLVFAFVVTRPQGVIEIPGRAYKEYYVSGFSTWLRNYVTNGNNWVQIRDCLSQSDTCQKLAKDESYFTAEQFFQTRLSPLQSGCCKRPTACGFTYVNPTVWVNPVNATIDSDCLTWSNDQSRLCYDCQSCRAGMLENLHHEWHKANSGCCKPPTACGFTYVNPTVWVNPVNPTGDPDCVAWSNDQSQLCYDCQSCRAGMLGNLRQEWRKANVAVIVAVVVLIWVYVIGCSAFKNAQTEDLFRRYKQGYT